MKGILEKYEDVFQNKVPNGIPPAREVDHDIEVEENLKPPFQRLYQLFPAEMLWPKTLLKNFANQGKFDHLNRLTVLHYYFVSGNDNSLRGVVDYPGLYRI